jgi:hypothetical protein
LVKSVRLVLLGVTLGMAGCGSSSGGSSGSLGGSFTATGAMALSYAPAVCPALGGGTEGLTMLDLVFSNVPNICSAAYLAAGQCNGKANLTAVIVFIQRGKPGGATTALTAGTYPLTLSGPVADAGGNYTSTAFGYGKTDATCTAATVSATAGSVTISTISATRVTGSMTATFSDGSTYSSAFDVPICADSASVCAATAGCTGTPVCIP